MSNFRFGDDYKLNLDESHQVFDGYDDSIDWDVVDWVEIDGTRFIREDLNKSISDISPSNCCAVCVVKACNVLCLVVVVIRVGMHMVMIMPIILD